MSHDLSLAEALRSRGVNTDPVALARNGFASVMVVTTPKKTEYLVVPPNHDDAPRPDGAFMAHLKAALADVCQAGGDPLPSAWPPFTVEALARTMPIETPLAHEDVPSLEVDALLAMMHENGREAVVSDDEARQQGDGVVTMAIKIDGTLRGPDGRPGVIIGLVDGGMFSDAVVHVPPLAVRRRMRAAVLDWCDRVERTGRRISHLNARVAVKRAGLHCITINKEG